MRVLVHTMKGTTKLPSETWCISVARNGAPLPPAVSTLTAPLVRGLQAADTARVNVEMQLLEMDFYSRLMVQPAGAEAAAAVLPPPPPAAE